MVRGPATTNATLSFQKWERLERTGLLNRRTKARLATAKHPTPIGKAAAGKRAEVLLDRRVALLIDDNKVVRTVAVSPERRRRRRRREITASTPRSHAG